MQEENANERLANSWNSVETAAKSFTGPWRLLMVGFRTHFRAYTKDVDSCPSMSTIADTVTIADIA
jgi:hypothetical protein